MLCFIAVKIITTLSRKKIAEHKFQQSLLDSIFIRDGDDIRNRDHALFRFFHDLLCTSSHRVL